MSVGFQAPQVTCLAKEGHRPQEGGPVGDASPGGESHQAAGQAGVEEGEGLEMRAPALVSDNHEEQP